MKNAVKKLLYTLKIASLLNRFRNKHLLTTVMFHRVLPHEDPRCPGANPNYTVSPEEFRQCLTLFKDNYNIVSLQQLDDAARGKPLPPNPLLITFDDGWKDNLDYALPILKEMQLPSLLFVAADYIGEQSGFWQEDLLDRVIRDDLTPEDRRCLYLPEEENGSKTFTEAQKVVSRLDKMPTETRESLLNSLSQAKTQLPRQMLTDDELQELDAAGMEIGGHGFTHTPLTRAVSGREEIRQCSARLNQITLTRPLRSFSYPHGSFNDAIFNDTLNEGFKWCFSSDHCLESNEPNNATRPLGRIEINLKNWRDTSGKLDLPGLAFFLFTQPAYGRR